MRIAQLLALLLVADGAQPTDASVPVVWIGASMEDGDDCSKVVAVVGDGPADRSGLRAGDCVRQIDDRRIRRTEDILQALQTARAGTVVAVVSATGSHKLLLEVRPHDAERRLCRTVAGTRTRVLVQGPGQPMPRTIDLPPSTTFAAVRQRSKATQQWAAVTLQPDCDHLGEAPRIVKQPTAELVLTNGSYVMFFEKRPEDGSPLLLSPGVDRIVSIS